MQWKMNKEIIRKKDKIKFQKNNKRKILEFFGLRIVLNIRNLSLNQAQQTTLLKPIITFAKLDQNFSGIFQNAKSYSSIFVKDVKFFPKSRNKKLKKNGSMRFFICTR